MSPILIIFGILLILSCVIVIVVIALQSKSSNGLAGAIMGGDSAGFGGSNKQNEKMTKLTKILAGAFFGLTLITSLICMALVK